MIDFMKNIENSDRMSRAFIGFILLVAAAFGLGRIFMAIVGVVLVIEGVVGWCGLRVLTTKYMNCCPFSAKKKTDCNMEKKGDTDNPSSENPSN